MTQEFYRGNWERLYGHMRKNSLLGLFSGAEARKTNDEYYPFYTNRDFLYPTGQALDGDMALNNVGAWRGGAHHVGVAVHDAVETPEVIAPHTVFCVDVGIYHEEWGIGFQLEDSCLVTGSGCENLSAATPRTIQNIEDTMCQPSAAVPSWI